MAKYIALEAAVDAVTSVYYNTPDINLSADKLEVSLRRLPTTADVAPVVHGRWEETDWLEYDAQSCETIRHPKAAIACTICRCAFKKEILWPRNFCPDCGARMDGDSDATN